MIVREVLDGTVKVEELDLFNDAKDTIRWLHSIGTEQSLQIAKAIVDRSTKITREEHILSVPWRLGNCGGSIVCAESNQHRETVKDIADFYGGLLVAESCALKVREHVIKLHNESLRQG